MPARSRDDINASMASMEGFAPVEQAAADGMGGESKVAQGEALSIRSGLFRGPAFARVLPFALFMAFIGLQEAAAFLEKQAIIPPLDLLPFILYPLKTLAAGAALLFLGSHYAEVRPVDLKKPVHTALSLLAGLFVFVAWIHLDYSLGGEAKGFDPTLLEQEWVRTGSIVIRLLGAVVVVPVMEELFWRSFLLRYIIHKDFTSIPIGTFTWASFLITAVLFGLEHHLIVAGVMAGIVYNLLLVHTRSIAQCILSHAVTNLCLGIHVLSTGQWRFW